jgi:DNA mismatch repair ATPase MutS
MIKLIDQYYSNKIHDNNYLYLFKTGMFYIFLADDAYSIHDKYKLKLVKLNDEIYKCGFPINSLDKYMNLFKQDNLKIIIVNDNYNPIDYNKLIILINKIKKLDLNNNNLKEEIKELKELL